MGFRHLLAAAMLVATVSAGIYPADHWSYSTKMTVDTFDGFISDNLDAGKTIMAPAWNAIVKEFGDNENVVFADVNLRDARIVGNHSPGKGGWPTVRYFNADTGVAGAPYVKKTKDAMCTELGNKMHLRNYVNFAMGVTNHDEL